MSVTTTPRVTTCRGTARVNLDSRETGTQLSFYLPPTNTYGCQADGTHPIGMLSCLKYVIVHATAQWRIQDDQDQKGGFNLLFGKMFAENSTYIKEILDQEGVVRILGAPSGSATATLAVADPWGSLHP